MTRDLANRVRQNNQVQQRGGGGDAISALWAMEKQFQLAMPKGVEAAQLIRDAITVIRANPKLLEASQASLMGCLMTCAQLGLRPGVGALGHAYIIPFKGQAQLIIGYQGLIELAQRSGKIASLSARIVYQNDDFDVEYGLEEKLRHKPVLFGERGPAIGYYAVVHYTTGGHSFIFANRTEIEQHRDKFAMAKRNGGVFGPWVDHFDAMAQKTVIRELAKYMPKSTELQGALVADESVRVDAAPDADLNQVTQQPTEDEYIPGEQVDETTGELPGPTTPDPSDAGLWASEKQENQA